MHVRFHAPNNFGIFPGPRRRTGTGRLCQDKKSCCKCRLQAFIATLFKGADLLAAQNRAIVRIRDAIYPADIRLNLRREFDMIDLTVNGRFFSQPTTGVQRYAREILAELDLLIQDPRINSHVPVNATVVLPANSDVPSLSAFKVRRTAGTGVLWDQFALPLAKRGVLLSLGNQGPIFASEHIICIHDLNVALAPSSYSAAFRSYYRIILPVLARTAAHVVTVSEFSAQMLSESGFCAPDKITVIPNGHEHIKRWTANNSTFRSKAPRARPFVFTLGSRAPHKNIGMLFSIAHELDALGLDLLVAGTSMSIFSTLDTPRFHLMSMSLVL